MLGFAFALSGFSALTYQVVWQRVMTQAIGSDAISMVLVVGAFMTFLGIGSELARRLLQREIENIVLIYATIEIAVGIYGLFSVNLIRTLNAALSTTAVSNLLLDSTVNMALLALPIIGMGMTTPLIVQCARGRIEDLGRTVGFYYGLNIVGAAIGALIGGVVLIEFLGLVGTSVVAACVNIAIGLILFANLRGGSSRELNIQKKPDPSTLHARMIVVAICFGFCTLAVQIALFRVLANYFTMSTIVFPIVLCVYLLLMAAGQWWGGHLADKHSQQLPAMIGRFFCAGSVSLAAALIFPPSWAAKLGALSFTTFNGSLLSADHQHLIGDPNPFTIFLFSALILSVVLFWSSLFPLSLRIITRQVDQVGEQFARLYLFYTFGNLIGTAIFGLYIIPALGTGASLSLTIAVGTIGVYYSFVHDKRKYTALAISIVAAIFIPQQYYKNFQLDGYLVDKVYEGVNGVVTTAKTSRFYTIIDMNRTASASAIVRDPQKGDAYEAWRWNLTDLLVLDPTFRPKNILIIGIGHAYLIDALLDLPFVENIVVVDISKEVVDAVRENTLSSTGRVFTDPRVEIVIADGRRYVQRALAEGKKFDLIQNKINEPWHAGSGNLFTVDFFASKKALLRDGGYLAVRPLAGHVKDALRIFGSAIYPGQYHVYFRNGPTNRPTQAVVTPEIEPLWFRNLPGRDERVERLGAVPVTFFTSADAFADVAHNTDNWPSLEYYHIRKLLGIWNTPRESLSADRYDNLRFNIPVIFENAHAPSRSVN